ncbi:hypothetical protein ACFQ0G_05755 [Streptomyces chiangmaiensis]
MNNRPSVAPISDLLEERIYLPHLAYDFFGCAGDGKIRTPELPVSGAPGVTRSRATLPTPSADVTLAEESLNGRAGPVVRCGRDVPAAISLNTQGRRITHAWLILNPDKLHGWNTS